MFAWRASSLASDLGTHHVDVDVVVFPSGTPPDDDGPVALPGVGLGPSACTRCPIDGHD